MLGDTCRQSKAVDHDHRRPDTSSNYQICVLGCSVQVGALMTHLDMHGMRSAPVKRQQASSGWSRRLHKPSKPSEMATVNVINQICRRSCYAGSRSSAWRDSLARMGHRSRNSNKRCGPARCKW